jgi:hypothetical protein
MGPHDWLGVPRIPSPARDLRVVPFFVASAIAHVALVSAVRGTDGDHAFTIGTWHLRELRAPAEDGPNVAATIVAPADEWAEVEAAPGSRVALALDTAGRRHAGGRDAAGGDPEIGVSSGVDLRELVHEGSWAAVMGTADLDDGLTGFAAGDFTTGDMTGGFTVGTMGGACCGGSGWGTIGTGRYGTIGQGSGATYNYGGYPGDTGGRRFVRPAEPRAAISRPDVTCASCDPTVFYRAFRGCVSIVRYCYEKELLTFPSLGHVKLRVAFVVLPGGNITSVVLGAGGNDGLRDCIRDHYEAMRVNKNVDEPVGITLDLKFAPR